MMLQMHVQSSVGAHRHSAKASALSAPRVSCARVARPSTRPSLAAQQEPSRRELVRLAVAEQDYTDASYGEQDTQAAEAESSQVFVANLPFSATSDDLGDLFSRCNGYSRAIVLMRDGRSRGIGLVDFATPADAQAAVEEMNETEFNGRNMLARISVPPPKREYGERRQQYGDREQYGERRQQYGDGERPQYGERRERQPYGERRERQDRGDRPPRPPAAPGSTIYVSNLSYQTTWMEMKDYFGSAGQVEFAKVLSSPDGRSRGCGMVTFSSAQEADAAIQQFNESELSGRRLNVRKFIPREEM